MITEQEAREWFEKYIDSGIDTLSDLTIVDIFLQAGRELGFISDSQADNQKVILNCSNKLCKDYTELSVGNCKSKYFDKDEPANCDNYYHRSCYDSQADKLKEDVVGKAKLLILTDIAESKYQGKLIDRSHEQLKLEAIESLQARIKELETEKALFFNTELENKEAGK